MTMRDVSQCQQMSGDVCRYLPMSADVRRGDVYRFHGEVMRCDVESLPHVDGRQCDVI